MKTYLLETDVLIDLFKKKHNTTELIQELSNSGNIVMSVLTISELRSAWDKKEASIYLPKLYAISQAISVTQEIAEYAGKLRNEYLQKGQTLPTLDTLIASTCILNNFCLVTRNIRHYPMPEIELYN